MQQHLHNICQPQTLPFLERVRTLCDEFEGRMTVAEIGSQNNLQRMVEYTRGQDRLHTAYSFMLLGPQPKAAALAEAQAAWHEGDGAAAWPSWALSNHDAPRVATRWAQGNVPRTRQLLALLACLRGTVFLYQGEELGLPQADLALEELQDPLGKANWPHEPGRDGCRTPMPWMAGTHALGFTTGQPWLPLAPAHQALAVDSQEADTGSTLHLTRRLLALRRRHAALRLGELATLHADEQVWVLRRQHGADTVWAAFNFGPQAQALTVPGLPAAAAIELQLAAAQLQGSRLTLPAASALVMVADTAAPCGGPSPSAR
jgi:alpha-glucosidase